MARRAALLELESELQPRRESCRPVLGRPREPSADGDVQVSQSGRSALYLLGQPRELHVGPGSSLRLHRGGDQE